MTNPAIEPGPDDWQRCRVHRRLRGATPLSVDVRPDPARLAPGDAERIDEVWRRRAVENPRLFDGPMLAFVGYDHDTAIITAARDRYRRLAAFPEVDTAVKQLGVTAMLVARGVDDRPCVLFGRRSPETRCYGGLWELGPSGGVDPPPLSIGQLDQDDLWRAALGEIREELGLPVDPDPGPVLALVDDPIGGSFEAVFRVDVAAAVEELTAFAAADPQTSRWEYTTVRWLSIDELSAFDAAEAERIIPPTRAVLRALGWIPL